MAGLLKANSMKRLMLQAFENDLLFFVLIIINEQSQLQINMKMAHQQLRQKQWQQEFLGFVLMEMIF